MAHRRHPAGTRAFRRLLALYPAAFRDEYQRELMLVFLDRYLDATSPRARARLWIEALAGIAVEAPKEHARMFHQDLFYALRMLRKHLLLTATIVVTLGVGIGVNTAIFSLLNAVVLKTLPVPAPEQLFAVRAELPLAAGNRFTGPMFERLQGHVPGGAQVAAISRVARVHTRLPGALDTEPASLQLVSPRFFEVMDVPVTGGIGADGPSSASDTTVVISHAYWQRRFFGAADVVGRTITINGASFTVAGVAARGFAGVWLESPVELWTSLAMQPAVKYAQNFSADRADQSKPWMTQERIWWLDVIARIRSGSTAAVAAALDGGVPDSVRGSAQVRFETLASGFSLLRQRFETPLTALLVMAALVLLAACANVANLLLARGASQQRELAVRMSLGAGRLRLLHQLLTESALLVLLASAAAVLFGRWAGDLLVATATASTAVPPPFDAPIDLRVLGFTGGVALMAVVLFGVLPAWRTTRVDLSAALKAGGRGTLAGRAERPARLLVVVQVAVSLVLVAGTGLLARSFQDLLRIDAGFDRARLLSVSIDPRLSASAPGDASQMYRRVLERVRALPGVRAATLAMCGLQTNCRAREDGFEIEGYTARPGEQVVFLVNAVDEDYFETVGMRLLAGRPFGRGDVATAPNVAIVNRALASKYFANGQAIGRRFGSSQLDIEIVGIVEDARQLSVRDAAVPAAFFAMTQRPVFPRSLEIRTAGDPAQLTATVRKAIAEAAPGLAVESLVPVETRIAANLSQERLVVYLTSGFGVIALGLAGFGLFGVLSYAVARRTAEIGIRVALGASRTRVHWSIVREALTLVVAGFVVGAPLVFAGVRMLPVLIAGVSGHDWSSVLGAMITLLVVGLLCSVWPALRASRVDPIVALRQD